MNLEARIARLEGDPARGRLVHVVRVAYLADEAEQAVAQRVALERDPTPRGVKVTVYVIDYSRVEA